MTHPSPDPAIRRCHRVLQMVHELHKRGYQLLRISPGFNSSGTSWRCYISLAANTTPDNPALLQDHQRNVVVYSSADGNQYFEWSDSTQDNARVLADKFIARFPDLVASAAGSDWPYVGWYVEMLGVADRGVLPVAFEDLYEPHPPGRLRTTQAGVLLPLPPAATEA